MRNSYDVVVIGGGNAGICAALSASESSDSVLLVEAASTGERAGNSKYTRDIRYLHERDKYSAGDYPKAEFMEDVLAVTKNNTDLELLDVVLSESRQIPQWLEKHSVMIHKALKGTLHLTRTNLFMLGGGKAMMNSYYDSAGKRGIETVYDTECTEIILDGDSVTEIVLSGPMGKNTVKLKSLVIAAGGFEANIEWLKEFWGEAAENFIIRGSKFNTGKLLRQLMDLNAKTTGDVSQFHSVAVDARSPQFDGGIVTRIDSLPFGITVNNTGKRFYDEGEDLWPKRYAIWGRMIAQQPDQMAFSIVDSKTRGFFLPTVFEPFEADTVEELARKMNVNVENLVSTVQEFNDSIDKNCSIDPKILDRCGTKGLEIPKSNWASPIDTPPYYGFSLKPGITFTYFGVKVNRKGHIMKEDGTPFRNLFAAGEIMSGNILSQGYLAGFGLTIGTVFGIISGKEAALVAKN